MIYIYIIFLLLALISGWAILREVPTLNHDIRNKKKLKTISIIIPARNEENKLPILLNSLQKQTIQPLEILVVDDHSEDQTAAVASDYGAHVVQFQADETGWVGKSAACFEGAKVAKGEWLFFLDADIFLPKETSLEKILDHFQNDEEPGLLSIQPYHEIEDAYENLSVIFNILILAGMNAFSVFKDRLEPAGAFGPSMLCTRETYFQVGGHQGVKGSIMENVELGKIFLEEEVPVRLYGGKGSLHFRMYPEGLTSLAEGWTKSFASGSKSTHPLVLIGTSLWISGAFITFFFLLFSLLRRDGASLLMGITGYLFYFFQFYKMARMAGNFNVWLLFFYPFFFLYFVLLFAWSAIKTFLFRSVSWKGRKMST